MSHNPSSIIVRVNLPEGRAEEHNSIVQTLVGNLKAALDEHDIEYSDTRVFYDRIVITSKSPKTAAEAISTVFGVKSFSIAVESDLEKDNIMQAVALLARGSLDSMPEFRISAIEPCMSQGSIIESIEELRDAMVSSLAEIGLEPNDSHHSTSMELELTCNSVFISTSIMKGLGGLPTGFEGRVVCMISSGLDSPIASFKAMRRGCVPIFVYFDNSPFSDDINKEVAIRQSRRLTRYAHGSEIKMYIVPHGEDLVEILKHTPRRMTCVFCRRNMYRMAQEVALREHADAIITGEIIGEQASQTTRNLFAETSAISEIPIIRPCIGNDKDEITKIARDIGTYEFAEEATSCCSLPPKYPVLNADPDKIHEPEAQIGEGWVRYAVDDAEVIILKKV